MADGVQLLRLLDPIVRPDGRVGQVRVAKDTALPIESRSFDSLLQEARAMATDGFERLHPSEVGSAHSGEATPTDPGLLKPLGQVERIENASLLRIVTGGR